VSKPEEQLSEVQNLRQSRFSGDGNSRSSRRKKRKMRKLFKNSGLKSYLKNIMKDLLMPGMARANAKERGYSQTPQLIKLPSLGAND